LRFIWDWRECTAGQPGYIYVYVCALGSLAVVLGFLFFFS
jgi:hypothetical protein